MAIRGGRAAAWIGGKARDSMMPLAVGGIATAGVMGAGAAIMDREGPWADVQEFAFGDPDAIRASLKAGVSDFMSRNNNDVYGRNDVYYGQPVSTSSARTNPISGDMVFGMYNLRR